MDKEAIQTSVLYQELSRQHFNGGYFSDAVREQGEKFKTLGEAEKRAFFADTFNTIYETAQQVQAHPKFSGETIDLTEQGLGTITISLENYSADEEGPAYKGVKVESDAFEPTPVQEEAWIDHPSDPLGLKTTGPTMVQRDQEPDGWDEHINASPNGNFHDNTDYFGDIDIDTETMRLLDAKETLDIVTNTLSLLEHTKA